MNLTIKACGLTAPAATLLLQWQREERGVVPKVRREREGGREEWEDKGVYNFESNNNDIRYEKGREEGREKRLKLLNRLPTSPISPSSPQDTAEWIDPRLLQAPVGEK